VEEAVPLVGPRRGQVVLHVVFEVVDAEVVLPVGRRHPEEEAHHERVGAIEDLGVADEGPVHRAVEHQDDGRHETSPDRQVHGGRGERRCGVKRRAA